MLKIKHHRFLRDLEQLAGIGLLPQEEGGGRERPAFSSAEREARRYIIGQAEGAELGVRTDPAGNLIVRLECGPADAKTLMLGSHIDTVPNGGPYDGALGVLAALEVLRVVRENGLALPFHLEAVAFTDEEGRFVDFFGSHAAAGSCTAEMVQEFIDKVTALSENLETVSEFISEGLSVEGVRTAARQRENLAGYLELHIEQGPRLEHSGVPIGVVSAIFGRITLQLTFTGRPDHAGTTPMDLRADALLAAADCMRCSCAKVREQYPGAVITFGDVAVEPGVYNVVPGRVTILSEFRAASEKELQQILIEVEKIAAEVGTETGVDFDLLETSRSLPVEMHPSMQNAIRHAAETLQYEWIDLPSGAGHDTQIMAQITPVGMIFVPSIGGRSHCPEENTKEADLIAGADVLLQTVLTLSRQI